MNCGLLMAVALALSSPFQSPAATVIYQTGFEASEGYQTNLDLIGQNGWTGAGSGGNGLLSNFFNGKGQQAYVGFSPPHNGDGTLFVYPRLNQPVPQAQFSVLMAVYDSSNTNYDDFYWSLFNQQGDQLLSLDFDNYELSIYYYLNNTNRRTATGLQFTNGVPGRLNLALDFISNRWSATFNGALLATNQPIATAGAPLNLGDIDAGWVVYDTNAPGDNFMVFDDYRVAADVPPPRLDVLGVSGAGTTLRLAGQADLRFVIEASTNLVGWVPIRTNITTGGYFDYVDTASVIFQRRFYRGRWLP